MHIHKEASIKHVWYVRLKLAYEFRLPVDDGLVVLVKQVRFTYYRFVRRRLRNELESIES
jgi:hypothetical protein